MGSRLAKRWRDSALSKLRLLQRRLRREGVVEVYMMGAEARQQTSEEFKAIVAEWPMERFAGLEKKWGKPKSRVVALLGIGITAFDGLCLGKFTPGPALCRRMAQLEEM